jgi:hypothetical protein
MIGWSKMDERSPDTKYLSSMYWDCLNVKWDLNIIPCFIPLLSFVEFNMSFYRVKKLIVNKTICWGQYWFLRSIKTHIDWYKSYHIVVWFISIYQYLSTWQGWLDTTLFDKDCQWLTESLHFSYKNYIDHHIITDWLVFNANFSSISAISWCIPVYTGTLLCYEDYITL